MDVRHAPFSVSEIGYMEEVICKNCGQSFTGRYCNHCGQKATVGKIDWTYVSQDLLKDHLQLDSGLFRTFRDLSLRPGACIRDYLSGKRKRYFNPLSYLLLASALYVLTTHFFGLNTFASEVIAGYGTGISDNATAEYDYSSNPVLNLLTTLADNHTLFLLITLPLFSLSSYLAFRGAGYSYLEHVVINMLITSQQMFIYLVLSAVIVEGTLSEVLPILFGVAFNTWAFFTLCVSYRRITRLLRALLIYAIYAAQTIAVLVLLSQFAAV